MKLPRRYLEYLALALVSFVSAYLIFHNLGASTIYSWDEARHAENALEILKTGDWVVTNYGYQPDLWNLKPPLGAWLMAISFRIFGANEFGVRFFSALCATLTVVIVYLFGKEISGIAAGLFSSAILLSMPKFMGYHAARTGDYDALVAFFIALSMFSFYLFVKYSRRRSLVVAAAAIGAVAMIKDIVSLLPLGMIGIYLLYTRRLNIRDWAYPSLAFLLVTAPWYIIRFFRGREFFVRMVGYDILTRSTEQIEGHVGDWTYYFMTLKSNFNTLLLIVLLASIAFGIYQLARKNRAYTLVMIWLGVIMLVFTAASSKLTWYIVPAYPASALLMGITLGKARQKLGLNPAAALAILLIALSPSFAGIIRNINSPNIIPVHESLKQMQASLKNVDMLYMYKDEDNHDTNQATFFYLNSMISGRVMRFDHFYEIAPKPGDYFLTYTPGRFDAYGFRVIQQSGSVELYEKTK